MDHEGGQRGRTTRSDGRRWARAVGSDGSAGPAYCTGKGHTCGAVGCPGRDGKGVPVGPSSCRRGSATGAGRQPGRHPGGTRHPRSVGRVGCVGAHRGAGRDRAGRPCDDHAGDEHRRRDGPPAGRLRRRGFCCSVQGRRCHPRDRDELGPRHRRGLSGIRIRSGGTRVSQRSTRPPGRRLCTRNGRRAGDGPDTRQRTPGRRRLSMTATGLAIGATDLRTIEPCRRPHT